VLQLYCRMWLRNGEAKRKKDDPVTDSASLRPLRGGTHTIRHRTRGHQKQYARSTITSIVSERAVLVRVRSRSGERAHTVVLHIQRRWCVVVVYSGAVIQKPNPRRTTMRIARKDVKTRLKNEKEVLGREKIVKQSGTR
jgi:hypothetical protein